MVCGETDAAISATRLHLILPPLSLQLTFFIRAEFLLHPVRVIPVQVGSYTKHVDAQVVQVELCEVT